MKLHYWEWKFSFEPKFVWIGLSWKRYPCAIELFFCLVPTLLLRVYIQWHWEP
jgi:hypothetical protein